MVRHARYVYLLSRSPDKQVSILTGNYRWRQLEIQYHMYPMKRKESITYSTEEEKGSYPYCDRGRICDTPLDGHVANGASFNPRKVRRRGVAGRSRAIEPTAREGLRSIRCTGSKMLKLEEDEPRHLMAMSRRWRREKQRLTARECTIDVTITRITTNWARDQANDIAVSQLWLERYVSQCSPPCVPHAACRDYYRRSNAEALGS